jgi:hypothetical protein
MRLRDLLLGSAMALALGGAAVAAPAGIVIQPGGNGSGSVTSVGCPSGVITTSGNCLPLTVAGVAGDVVTAAGANGVQDSGTLLTALAPKASPTFTGTVDIPALDLTAITGSTQCLHVNTSGVVSGVGSDCGAGGGVTSLTATSPLTGGVITTTGSIGLPAPLAGATANYTAHGVLFGEGSASALAASAAGTAGQFLLSGGASADPAFSSLASLTSSGLFMAGATGGGEGVDTVNAKNFYQMGSLIQVVPFSSSCTPPACTYTLPGISDTLAGIGTAETITASWTHNTSILFPSGVGLRNNPAGIELDVQTFPSNGGAFYVAYSDSGATTNGGAAFGLGTFGTFSGASGILKGADFDPTINMSGTGGFTGYDCRPTLTAIGSGEQSCLRIASGATERARIDINGFQVALSAVPPATGTCAVGALTGGLSAGKMVTSGACGASTTVILTLPAGSKTANGIIGRLIDLTTPADIFNETATSATAVTFTGTAASGDTLVYELGHGF